MLKRLCLFMMCALLMVPMSAVVAQGDPFPNRYVAPDAGFTVYYPIGWTAELSGTAVTLSSGVIWLNTFRAVPSELGISPDDGAALLMEAFNPIDETVLFDPAGIVAQPAADRRIFTYPYDDTNENGPYSGFVVAVEAPDGSYLLADIYPRQGTSVAQADLDLSLDILRAAVVGDSGPEVTTVTTGAPDVEFFQTGIGVDLPDGWADLIDENDFLTLESDETVLEPRWYFPDEVADLGLAAGDVSGVMADVAQRLELEFDPASIETQRVDGRTLWTMDYLLEDSGGSYEALLAGVALDDGTVLTGWIFPLLSATLDERDAALAILGSARIAEGAPAPVGVPTPADAPLSESYTFEDSGVTFFYPAGWSIGDDEGFIYLDSEVSWIDPYYTLAEDLPGQGVVVGDLVGGLESLFTSLYEDIPFERPAVQRRVVEGRVVLVYPFEHTNEDGTHQHWLTITEMDDGTQFSLDAYPKSGPELQEGELAARITAAAALEPATIG
ncbi:MAG: hypothetical protein AAGU78_09350 [Chloroflexota bacterium]|nr:hypothetical protein [Anaerolineae bacterium]HMM27567.1 hypothetical protein [Aggregatilineaceae bacterium]HMM27614.1 hypothetical protein [Aggregatilineaceae bacterium]